MSKKKRRSQAVISPHDRPSVTTPLDEREAPPTTPPRWILPVLVAVYIALTLLLIGRVPLGQTPDEFAHFQYVEYIAARGALPVFVPRGAPAPGYEFHQPPLYYALCAPLWKASGAGVQNYVCRLVSLACGAATLVFLWRGVLALFPRNRLLAPLATGFAALWPLHQSVGASMGNDALAGLLCAAMLCVVAQGAARTWTTRDSLCLGLLFGLGLLTKTTCLLVGLAAIGAAWGLSRPARNENTTLSEQEETTRLQDASVHPSSLIPHPLLVLGVALLIGGWWLARNQRLYGDPLALGVFNQAFGNDPSAQLATAMRAGFVSLPQYARATLLTLFATAWGVFGGPNTALSMLNVFGARGPRPEALPALGPMFVCAVASALALWGLALRAAGWKRLPPRPRLALGWWLAALMLVVLAWAQFNTRYFQAQARYFHPALLPLALGFALGWERVLGRGRALRLGVVLLGATLLLLTLWNAFGWRTLV